jgi:hypothetical protein
MIVDPATTTADPAQAHMELIHRNPNTREAIEERIRSLGGRLSLRERFRHPAGSPFVWYQSGWSALDAVQERAPDMLRLGFERLNNGLLLHASQRHDAWLAFVPAGAWALEGPFGEEHRLQLGDLTLTIRIPPQHQKRFLRFSERVPGAA